MKSIPVFHKTVKSNHLEILRKFDKTKDKPGNRSYPIDFSIDQLPYTCAIDEIGQLPRGIDKITKRYNKETALLIIQQRIINKLLRNRNSRYFNLFEEREINTREQSGNYNSLVLRLKADGTCDFNYMVTFTVVLSSRANVLFRDAMLGILPFKLISKGTNVNSTNELETYALV